MRKSQRTVGRDWNREKEEDGIGDRDIAEREGEKSMRWKEMEERKRESK